MRPARSWHRYAAPLSLFVAAGVVVLIQSQRQVALWDLSYVLETAHRLAAGDRPYVDVVMPHAPLTFVVQAMIIRLGGMSIWWPIGYCAFSAGMSAVLTSAIARRLIGACIGQSATAFAWLAAVPVVFLNGYAILPQPFYDSDCVLFVLLGCYVLLGARARHDSRLAALAGFLLVLPIATKQNIGLTAFAAIHATMFLSTWKDHGTSAWREWRSFVAGSAAGLCLFVGVIAVWTGWDAYAEWTVEFAARRRWPHASLLVAPYQHGRAWLAIAVTVAAFYVFRSRQGTARMWSAAFLLSLPVLESLRTMLRWGVGARSYVLWAIGTTGSVLVVLDAMVAGPVSFEAMFPLVSVAIAHGGFASQGLADSAYAVWPLLILALVAIGAQMIRTSSTIGRGAAFTLVFGLGVALTVLGARQLQLEERLGFVDSTGPVTHARLPRLAGLSARGPYVPAFERLVEWTAAHLPADAKIVNVPGEDPFFYATGRTPVLPFVLFDATVTPFTASETLDLMERLSVDWVILKTPLQLRHSPWPQLEMFSSEVRRRYSTVAMFDGYSILTRAKRTAAARPSVGRDSLSVAHD